MTEYTIFDIRFTEQSIVRVISGSNQAVAVRKYRKVYPNATDVYCVPSNAVQHHMPPTKITGKEAEFAAKAIETGAITEELKAKVEAI